MTIFLMLWNTNRDVKQNVQAAVAMEMISSDKLQ